MSMRRLRGRLDQLQGKSNQTLNQAQELIALGEAFLADVADGLGVTVHIDEGAAKTLMSIMLGRAGKLPLSVQIDPSVDTLPSRVCDFVGGSHDSKRYSIPDTKNKEIVLTGGEVYLWDGKVMRYQG